MKKETWRRLEFLIMSAVASVGMFECKERHNWCGHIEHSAHDQIGALAFDAVWIFALSGVAVTGISGRFHGARPIGIICAIIILLMAIFRSTPGRFGGAILAILVLVQLVDWAVQASRNQKQSNPPHESP